MRSGAEQLRPTISLDLEETPGRKLPQEKLFLFGFDIIPDFEEALELDSTSTLAEFEFGGKYLKVERSFAKEGYTNQFQLSWNDKEKSPLFAESVTINLGEENEQQDKVRVTYKPLGDYRLVGEKKLKEMICYTWNDQKTLDNVRELSGRLKRNQRTGTKIVC